MSRGYGKCERTILEAIQRQGGWLYLRDILPKEYTNAEYNALHRAASNLAKGGKIGYHYFMCGTKKVAIGQIGTVCKRNRGDNELSVEAVTSGNLVNT